MGDVAMTVPVIYSLLKENPELKITFVSRPFFKPLFRFSDRITFVGADLKGKYKGILGLRLLAHQLCKDNQFDAVIDIHNVLRTKIIRNFLKIQGQKVFVFDKGRKEKKAIVQGGEFKKLKHSTKRYIDAFSRLKLNINLVNEHYLNPSLSQKTKSFLESKNISSKIIGIAPFAAHKSKEWGAEKIENLISKLTKNHTVILFGGGQKEITKLNNIEAKFGNCFSVAGKFSFEEELELINNIDFMISMDSANMHLATICNTPVVSIWGPTHHYLGFGPLNNEDNIVEISRKELPCRPASIYGRIENKKQADCAKKAMEMISVEMVLDKVNHIIK